MLLLATGEVVLGRPMAGMVIVGWSVLNRPDWLERKNDKPGYPRGEDHPKVFLSDKDCDLIREIYDQSGAANGGDISYSTLALKFECSKSTIRDIIKCRRRGVHD
jgi:hypothetical protein